MSEQLEILATLLGFSVIILIALNLWLRVYYAKRLNNRISSKPKGSDGGVSGDD